MLVLHLATALAAIGSKFQGQNADRCAGMAVVAMRSVYKCTAAPEPLLHQIAVDTVVDLLTWSRHLRAGYPAINIAAGIRSRGVILNLGKGKAGAMCHALAVFDAASSVQYTGSNTQAGFGCDVRLVTRCMNAAREISLAPREARWCVFCWQSMSGRR